MPDFNNNSSNFENEHKHDGLDGNGFVSDSSCENEYEQHEDHSYNRSCDEGNYTRTEADDDFRSGTSGTFYHRSRPTYNRNEGSYDDQQEQDDEPMVGGKGGSRGLGIASMVCGITSLLFCCIPFIGVVVAIVGLILGIIAQVKRPSGFAVAGIITSAFGVVFGVIMLVITISHIIVEIKEKFDIIVDSSFPDDSFDPNNEAALGSIKSILRRIK